VIAANDLASPMSIAGRSFSIRDRAGGLLNLRIALQGSTASEFARDLAALDGVRVVRGPESISRGTCYLVHCLGFKLVLSADEADDSMLALVSRVPTDVVSERTSELSATLTLLMQEQPARPSDASPWRKGFAFGKATARQRIAGAAPPQDKAFSAASFLGKKKPSPTAGAQPMRRTTLRPGKPLARKTPLVRRTPLHRGKGSWR
jgi:hypothetical protein